MCCWEITQITTMKQRNCFPAILSFLLLNLLKEKNKHRRGKILSLSLCANVMFIILLFDSSCFLFFLLPHSVSSYIMSDCMYIFNDWACLSFFIWMCIRWLQINRIHMPVLSVCSVSFKFNVKTQKVNTIRLGYTTRSGIY